MHACHKLIKRLKEAGTTNDIILEVVKEMIDPTCTLNDICQALKVLGMGRDQQAPTEGSK